MSIIRDFAQVDLICNGKEAVAELDRTRKKVGVLNAALDAARKRGDKIEANLIWQQKEREEIVLSPSDSCGIQTHNLLIRSQMLYSVELRSHPSREVFRDCECKSSNFFPNSKAKATFFSAKKFQMCFLLVFEAVPAIFPDCNRPVSDDSSRGHHSTCSRGNARG